MRTHSGLHVLCGVVFRDFGALVTGGNMEPLTARMDFDLPDRPAGLPGRGRGGLQRRDRGRPADRRPGAAQGRGVRDPRHHPHRDQPGPRDVKEVRIVDIVGLDQQADGGTHVASTSQVGRIEVVKIENKGKGFRRLRIRIAD